MVQMPQDSRRARSPETSTSNSPQTTNRTADPSRSSQAQAQGRPGSGHTAYYPPTTTYEKPREPTPPAYDAGQGYQPLVTLAPSPSPSMPDLAPADSAPPPGWGYDTDYGSWSGGTQPSWDYSGWQTAQPHELGVDAEGWTDDRWWNREYMENLAPRPGPGALPPKAAGMIHATYHPLYRVSVRMPSFPPVEGQPAATTTTTSNAQPTATTNQLANSGSSIPPASNIASHRPPSEEEVRYSIPHPHVQFCRRDMVWVFHQVKSSIHLPRMLPNSGTLPDEAARKASRTCVDLDDTAPFSASRPKTHHFHHYAKSVRGSSLDPPFVRRAIDLENASAGLKRSASNSGQHRADEVQSKEILLDLWVCCRCQTHIIASGPEAVLPTGMDGVLLQRYIEERENECVRDSKEESALMALETILRMLENFLFKLEARLVKVGESLVRKVGWTPVAQELLKFMGFQHTPVPPGESETHPHGRLQPPTLTDGQPDSDMQRARLLQAWLELSIVTQHYRRKNETALQGYGSTFKLWVDIENTYDETRRQIGAHESQIKQLLIHQAQLIQDDMRQFWEVLGTTPETHSAELVKLAYRRQTHCDPPRTPMYYHCIRSVTEWAIRARHSSAEALQVFVGQETSRGRWTFENVGQAAVLLGIISEDQAAGIDNFRMPPPLPYAGPDLQAIWLARVKQVNAELAENRISRIHADDRKRDLKDAYRVLAEYSGDADVVRIFLESMKMYGNGMVDVQDAYNTLEAPKELDEEMVVVIFNMRVEDQPNLRERMISALLVIAEDRNSERLKKLALTGKDDGPPPPESSRPDWPRGLQQLGNTCYLNSLLQYFYTIKDLREAISSLDVRSEISDEEIKQGRVGGRLVTKREVERSKKFVRLLRDLFMQLEWSTEQAVKPELELAKLALVTSKDEEDDVNSERSDATNASSLRSQSTLVEEPMPMGPLPQFVPRAPGSPSSSTGAVADESAAASPTPDDHFEGTARHASLEVHHGSIDEVKEGFVVVNPPRRVTIAEENPATMKDDVGDVAMRDAGEQERRPGNPPPLPPRKKVTEGGMMFGKQHDVSECMDNCMFQIEAAMKFGMEKSGWSDGDSESSIVKRLFYGKMRQRITVLPEVTAGPSSAPSSSSIHEKEDLFSQLLVNVDDEGYDLYDGIAGRFDDNIEFEGKQAHMDTYIVDLPPVLQIQLQRVQFNRETLEAYKSNAYVKFDESLFLDRFLSEVDPQKKARSKEIEAKLRACRERLSELTKGTGTPYDKALANTYNTIAKQNLIPIDADLLHDLEVEGTLLQAELAQCREEAASLKAALEDLWKDDRKVEYELSSVFIHRGSSPSFGHYFFYARDLRNNPDKWLKYNDQDVASVSKADVLADTTGSTANPYLLVFARKGANVIDIVHRANFEAQDVDMLDA